MTCKEGFIVKIIRTTPMLEEGWQALKDMNQLDEGFGIGSEVRIESIQDDEAIVLYESELGAGKMTVPISCLSCHIEPGVTWDGTNKELISIPEDDVEGAISPPLTTGIISNLGIDEQISYQRICGSCGSTVSEVDTICNVCGGMLPPIETYVQSVVPMMSDTQAPGEPAKAMAPAENIPVPEPDITAEEVVCPSCSAHLEFGATECVICDTVLAKSEPPKQPKPGKPEDEEVICPSCGLHMEPGATECVICNIPIQTAASITAKGAEPKKIKESKKILTKDAKKEIEETVCPSCGAFVEAGATECMICETPIVAAAAVPVTEKVHVKELPPEPAMEKPPVEKMPEPIAEESVCPSCGAFVEPDATECMICETPIAIAAALSVKEKIMETEPEKVPAPIEEPLEELPAEPPIEESVCPSCGAFAEPGATECMICDTPMTGEKAVEFIEAPLEPMPSNDDIEALAPTEETAEEVVTEPAVQEIVLAENELICPSCSKTIPADSETCPECWTDISLYMKCPSCSMLTPAGEKLCRECFAPIGGLEEPEPTLDLETVDDFMADIVIPDEMVISEELKEEMTILETQEEQGKECLVCGAIFGPEDMLCPICGIEYGVEIEEPEVPETEWDLLEVEVQPTIRTCPNCGNNITGLDATEREVSEGKWFYRGLITIFTGIFFTSFSIWARGINVENESLGLYPPPTDVVLNLLGWILVLTGFVFWYMSWRLHGQRVECPECGVESEPDMENCINCGVELIAPEEEFAEDEEQHVDEELLPKEDTNYLDKLDLPARRHADMPIRKKETPVEPVPSEEVTEEAIPELEIPEEATLDIEVAPEPDIHSHGEELPVEHENHKKCPGCGIFVDLDEKICPVCDTEFSVEPAPTVPSIEEELENLDAESTANNFAMPDSLAPHKECPSCGADVEAGTKACPVCEYPFE